MRYIGLILFALAVHPAYAQDFQSDAKQQEIERLIEALASPNKMSPDATARFPAGYDRRAQVRVLNAWEALLNQGYDAFPMLIEHVGDRRYSCTVETPSYEGPITVGEVCRRIVAHHVEVYMTEVWVSMGAYPYLSLKPDDLKKWWQNRKGRSLLQLQIEATEWALKRATVQSGTKAPASERAQKLERLLDRLKKAKQPLRPPEPKGTMICNANMVGLPKGIENAGAFGK